MILLSLALAAASDDTRVLQIRESYITALLSLRGYEIRAAFSDNAHQGDLVGRNRAVALLAGSPEQP